MKKNKKLIKLIDKYTRKRLVADSGLSKIMVDFVCMGQRDFGIIPDKKGQSTAEKVAVILGVDRAVVRPDIWG